MSGAISIDYNLNYNTDVMYSGASLLSAGQWRGALYRLSTRMCPGGDCSDEDRLHNTGNPDNWTFSKLFTAPQPITATPNASLDENHNLWIYCGTGRYYGFTDRSDPDLQNQFFGLKDPCYRENCDHELFTNDLHDSSRILVYGDGTLENTEATSWNDLLDGIEHSQGWYLNFSTGGERLLYKPNLLGGILSFSTYTPDTDLCSADGTSTLYTLYYKTGTAWKSSMWSPTREEVYGEGSGEGSSPENPEEEPIETKIPIEGGISSSPVMHMGKTGIILTTTGSSISTTLSLKPVMKMRSGMESWRED